MCRESDFVWKSLNCSAAAWLRIALFRPPVSERTAMQAKFTPQQIHDGATRQTRVQRSDVLPNIQRVKHTSAQFLGRS